MENEEKENSLLGNLISQANPGMFCNFFGDPIEFFVHIENTIERQPYEELILACGGECVDNEEDVQGSRTVVLAKKKPHQLPRRPVFKVSYVTDCVKENKLLDISDYVFYKRAIRQNNVPLSSIDTVYLNKRKFPKLVPQGEDVEIRSATVSSICHPQASSFDISRTNSVCKRTRDPYSMQEKEAILKFLVLHRKYEGLKGDSIWKSMESRNICLKRSYQSLKEHFTKRLVFELDRFSFLTDEQKAKFRKGFSR